ncbi:MAG: GTPase HflX [Lachnospiraceae bacterium]|nr:GTPase HflX [Lachnospiraceae bacterium]
MQEIREEEERQERVILVAVNLPEGKNADDGKIRIDVETSLDELEELCQTAGAETVGRVVQNLERFQTGTYIGSGKIQEIKELAAALDADAIVCDDELTPAQMRNLEDMIGIKICDRTMIILDIFAKHARTREGQIQVELAQLRYSLQRLTGKGIAMSRLGGGIGTRGPGEKKLEQDRRLIRDRISKLKSDLADIVKNREVLRKQREKNAVPVVAIVGYTNAGKSTLINKLTDSKVFAANMLFATLDSTTRNAKLPSGQEVLFTDTVGFINKLPHHLVDAFRSTLEEASYADIILHVVDSSDPEINGHMRVVYETLGRLKCEGKPVVTAFNKIDLYNRPIEEGEVREEVILKDLKADATLRISAKHGDGLDEMLEVIEKILNESKVYIEKTVPYTDGKYLNNIRKYGQIIEEDYREDGTFIKAYVPRRFL